MKNKISMSGIILLSILFILAIPLVITNIKGNNEFFDTSITSLLSLITVIYVSFYLTQKINDKRKKLDHIIELLEKIQVTINNDDFIALQDKNAREKALMLHRKISNKIEIIKDYRYHSDLLKLINEMVKDLQEMRNLYGEYTPGSSLSNDDDREIHRIINRIDHNCDKLQTALLN